MIRIDNAHVLGFEEFEQTLEHIANLQAESGYPPFNIERELNKTNEETILNITLAVAGFTEDLLEVTVEGRNLIIAGKKATEEKAEFLHQGIATRQFKKKFFLAETIEVTSAILKDGLLIIKLRKPEPVKVLRQIPITAG
ncbi:Hsp20 family protein [Hyphomicrobiales bacterium 4NK60-0047b]|jgi:HSP20 family molecular chaperone IbpA